MAATGFGGKRLVLVGTGKFLETTDNSAPATPSSSLYVLLDSSSTITDRTRLQSATIDTSGVVSAASFRYGTAANQKEGWLLDFPGARGERQVSEMQLDHGLILFSTLIPSGGACGEGGGNSYTLNVLNGIGSYRESSVGLMGGPMLVKLGNPVLSNSTTAGRRTATQSIGVLTQGSTGISIVKTTLPPWETARLSWRQVHNHRDLLP